MTEAGSIVYKITGDATQLKSTLTNIGKDSSGVIKQSGASVGEKLLSGLKTVLTVGAVTKIFKDTISAGAELEQALGGVQTLFKDSWEDVKANADKAFQTAGVSATKYMETVTSFSASLLQSLDGDTEKAVSVADRIMTNMADNASAFGTDISSIQNAYQGFAKQNYTMLDNLKLGYGGTKSEAERLVKEASKMKDAQEKLGITIDENSLSFDNLANAISVVQENMGVAGTVQGKMETTLTGSLNALKSAWTNLLAKISLGEDIQPALEGLIKTAKTFLVGNLIPAIINVVKLIPSALYKTITTFMPDLMNMASELITNFCKYIGDNFPMILQKGIEILDMIVKGIVENFPAIVSAIWEMALKIGKAIIDNFPMLLQKGIEIVLKILAGILKTIPELFSKVRSAFANIDWWSIGSNIISGIVNGLRNGVSAVVDAAKSVARSAFNAAKSWLGISSPSKEFMFLGKMVDEGLAQGIDKNIGEVEDSMKNITDSMLNTDLGVSPTTNNSVNYGGVVINMNVPQGMNGQQLVNEMENELAKRTIRRQAVFA